MADNGGNGANLTPQDVKNLKDNERFTKEKVIEVMGNVGKANGPARAASKTHIVLPMVRGKTSAQKGPGGAGNGSERKVGTGGSVGVGSDMDLLQKDEVKGDVKGEVKGEVKGGVKVGVKVDGKEDVKGEVKGQGQANGGERVNGDVKVKEDVKGDVKANGVGGEGQNGVKREGTGLVFGHGRATKSCGDMKLNH